MIAVVPVRDGRLPAGADAAVAEAAGRALLVGTETAVAAAAALRGALAELPALRGRRLRTRQVIEGLAGVLSGEPAIVLPASPDGRDLAGRLAAVLGRPCYAWCTEVRDDRVVRSRLGDVQSVASPVEGPFVATLVPRAHDAPRAASQPVATEVELAAGTARDAEVLGVDDADPAEVDLAEADRIVGGGLGLGGPEAFGVLARAAALLGASLGATRPVADQGIVGHERQIGTTGVAVDPALYLAFGISGAVQHTAGLGHPDRIIAVNIDAACPMMAMADLAVVADASATASALVSLLEEDES